VAVGGTQNGVLCPGGCRRSTTTGRSYDVSRRRRRFRRFVRAFAGAGVVGASGGAADSGDRCASTFAGASRFDAHAEAGVSPGGIVAASGAFVGARDTVVLRISLETAGERTNVAVTQLVPRMRRRRTLRRVRSVTPALRDSATRHSAGMTSPTPISDTRFSDVVQLSVAVVDWPHAVVSTSPSPGVPAPRASCQGHGRDEPETAGRRTWQRTGIAAHPRWRPPTTPSRGARVAKDTALTSSLRRSESTCRCAWQGRAAMSGSVTGMVARWCR
jgi:hypothetical protein